MAEGASRRRQLVAGLAVLVAGIGIGNAMSNGGDEDVRIKGAVVERSASTTEEIIRTTTSTSTTSTTTTIDPDAGCKAALETPEISGPFTACTATQYVALQPMHGPGKPELTAACRFRYMGPACDSIPTTTSPLPPPPPPPTTTPRRVPVPTGPKVTAPANDCDPNYAGECVPANVEDVDCAGGSGNGPYYVRGPVQVVGRDIYGLDGNDNDGIGCE